MDTFGTARPATRRVQREQQVPPVSVPFYLLDVEGNLVNKPHVISFPEHVVQRHHGRRGVPFIAPTQGIGYFAFDVGGQPLAYVLTGKHSTALEETVQSWKSDGREVIRIPRFSDPEEGKHYARALQTELGIAPSAGRGYDNLVADLKGESLDSIFTMTRVPGSDIDNVTFLIGGRRGVLSFCGPAGDFRLYLQGQRVLDARCAMNATDHSGKIPLDTRVEHRGNEALLYAPHLVSASSTVSFSELAYVGSREGFTDKPLQAYFLEWTRLADEGKR